MKKTPSTPPRRGRPYPADYVAMTDAIPRTRCLPETRRQYEALGGAEWQRAAIAQAYAELIKKQTK